MAPRKRKGPATLERKIYFFRADVGTADNGEPLPFDPRPALTALNQLPFTDEQGRYLKSTEGEAVCGWIDDIGERPKMRFGLVRRAGLPQIEESGILSDLNIATNAGLVEPVHLVFFPNNIVGMEFNFYGPRLSRLGIYLQTKCEGPFCHGMFQPLLRKNIVSQLDRLDDVRLFALKIRSSFASKVKEADKDLGAAFTAAGSLGNTDELEVTIRPAKTSQASMLNRVVNVAKSLVGLGEIQSESTRFVVKGRCEDTGKVESIDLLRDQLIAKKQIVRLGERSRALDKDSAYSAITTAYEEMKDQLKAAPSVLS